MFGDSREPEKKQRLGVIDEESLDLEVVVAVEDYEDWQGCQNVVKKRKYSEAEHELNRSMSDLSLAKLGVLQTDKIMEDSFVKKGK